MNFKNISFNLLIIYLVLKLLKQIKLTKYKNKMDSLWNESLKATIPDEIYPTYITGKANYQTKRITLTGDKKYIQYALYITDLENQLATAQIENNTGDETTDYLIISKEESNECNKIYKALEKKIKNKEGVISLTVTFKQFKYINGFISEFYDSEELKLEQTLEYYDYSDDIGHNINRIYNEIF